MVGFLQIFKPITSLIFCPNYLVLIYNYLLCTDRHRPLPVLCIDLGRYLMCAYARLTGRVHTASHLAAWPPRADCREGAHARGLRPADTSLAKVAVKNTVSRVFFYENTVLPSSFFRAQITTMAATEELSCILSRRQEINDKLEEGQEIKPKYKFVNVYTEFHEFSRKEIKQYEVTFNKWVRNIHFIFNKIRNNLVEITFSSNIIWCTFLYLT